MYSPSSDYVKYRGWAVFADICACDVNSIKLLLIVDVCYCERL